MRMTSMFQSMTSDIGLCGLLAGVRNIPSFSGILYPFPRVANPPEVRCTLAKRGSTKLRCLLSVKWSAR